MSCEIILTSCANACRSSRRGDRVETLFVAVHEFESDPERHLPGRGDSAVIEDKRTLPGHRNSVVRDPKRASLWLSISSASNG